MDFGDRLFRDPVHNLIALNHNSAADMVISRLIDCAEVQRLRSVRQLGLATFAYPGAEHSRFAHSIGVCHIATRMLHQLEKYTTISHDNKLAVRCAALLHDVGHGPLSHVLESLTNTPHEEWSQRVIMDSATEVGQVLLSVGTGFPARVRDMMAHRSEPGFLSEIISSQLDADRFDYLLRDSMMTGVKHGIFDLESVLALLRIDQNGEHLILDEAGIHPVEKYLQSRYHMFALVYLHRTVRSAESMVRLIMRRAQEIMRGRNELLKQEIAASNSPLSNALTGGNTISLSDYLSLNDNVLNYHLQQWATCSDEILSDLASRIMRRRVFKSIDLTGVEDLREKLAFGRAIVERDGADPEYYFVVDETSSAPYKPYDPQHGVGPHGEHILIRTPNGLSEYADIYDLSPVVKGLTNARISSKRVFFPEHYREQMQAAFHGDAKNLF